MKMLFGQRHAELTADGIRYWIEGRRKTNGRGGYMFASVVIWMHPDFQSGYLQIIRFDKPRPSAVEIQKVVESARFSLITLGDSFRNITGRIMTVVEIDQTKETVTAFLNNDDNNRKVYEIPASAIVEVL